jgi:hypothetical protein
MRSRSAPAAGVIRRGSQPLARRVSRGALRALYAHRPGATGSQEGWLTKQELAEYLRVTPRFIELQQHLGLPVLRMGAVNRYRVSEVEDWARRQYPASPSIGGPDAL